MSQSVEKILSDPRAAASPLDLFELSPVATLVFGTNGAVQLANGAAHRLLAAVPGALLGKSAALLLPELWSGATRLSVDVGESDPPRRVNARRIDGTTFPANVRLVCLPEEGPRFLATLEDLSDSERALADKAAEVVAANREFEKFIDVAAHDLRAPLRILTGFTDALEDECAHLLTDEGRTFLKEILGAGARMEGIIDGLLTLARSARAEMACESLDLTTLSELVMYELRHSAAERDVSCQVEPGLNGWGDVRLMMTVLRALLGNAWKFTSRRTGATIRCHAARHAGDTWFCVTDDGAGFDMTHADRLFKPFTRLHRHDEFPGHGLGLATVQTIVRRHGGEVAIESAPGAGTTVRFRLAPRPE